MVGFATEKFPKPRVESVVAGNVRLLGGALLPKPFAEFVGNTWTAPTPEIAIIRAP
jgi:hypothetical protein